jgi:hypothetical protein
MPSQNEPAEPIPDGIFAVAKQSWGDLFRWKQRVIIENEQGESYAEWQDPEPFKNPISLLMLLSARDWLFFLVGLAAWTADAFDFHALSIQQVKLADYYGKTKTDISTAITLTLLLRSVGAAFFGLAGDRFGRKWPMVINMIVLGVLQIATIYSSTFQQFLAVRSLFGLFMGGVYGNAIAMALEHCPYEFHLTETPEPFQADCSQCQRPWPHVWNPPAGLLSRLRFRRVRQSRRGRRDRDLQDRLLDCRCALQPFPATEIC